MEGEGATEQGWRMEAGEEARDKWNAGANEEVGRWDITGGEGVQRITKMSESESLREKHEVVV